MRYIPYVYFLRVPLVFAILLVLLPITGLWWKTPVQSIVRGMFDLGPGGTFTVCFATLLFGGALSVQTCLVLLYGRMRFFAAKLDEHELEDAFHIGPLGVPRVSVRFLVFYGACCAAMIAGVITGGDGERWWARAAAAGAAVALFGGVVVGLAYFWKSLGSKATEFIAKRLTWTPWGFLILRDPQDAPVVANAKADRDEWPFAEPAQLLPGHGFAALLLGVFAVFYALFALSQWQILNAVERNQSASVVPTLPTLASGVVLFGLLLWTLGLLSFLLDRYRIPVFLPLGAVLMFAAQFSQSDHFFDVQPLKDSQVHGVQKAIKPAAKGFADTAIVVTASGGGIKAAAWTVQVLSGLVHAMPEKFGPSIRVISSVSGGSVGALYFTHAYENGMVTETQAQKALKASMASSLDEVGWGLVYPDVWRSVMPLLLSPRIDRGWALESTFLREMKSIREGDWPTLGTWRADARDDKRPAVIFNTTAVESGERFLFSTVDLTKAAGRRSFHDLEDHEALDLRANTAARLSATFPYVTPVSRADCCGPRNQRFHFADGGYHDNFGIASASELLRQAMPAGTAPVVKRILMIQIMLDTPGTAVAEGSRGWFFQTFAPVATLLNMRDAAQFSRNQAEVELLVEKLRNQGVDTEVVQFPYPRRDRTKTPECKDATDPPVSWHMTESDKCDVGESWKFYVAQCSELRRIRKFLDGTEEGVCK